MIAVLKEHETFEVYSRLSVVPPTGQDKMEPVANRTD